MLNWFKRKSKKMDPLAASAWLSQEILILCKDGLPDRIATKVHTRAIATTLSQHTEDPASTTAIVGASIFHHKPAFPDPQSPNFIAQCLFIAMYRELTENCGIRLYELPLHHDGWDKDLFLPSPTPQERLAINNAEEAYDPVAIASYERLIARFRQHHGFPARKIGGLARFDECAHIVAFALRRAMAYSSYKSSLDKQAHQVGFNVSFVVCSSHITRFGGVSFEFLAALGPGLLWDPSSLVNRNQTIGDDTVDAIHIYNDSRYHQATELIGSSFAKWSATMDDANLPNIALAADSITQESAR